MKCFTFGILGFVLAAILTAIIVPLYSDYEDRAVTGQMLAVLQPVKQKIAEQLTKGSKISIQIDKLNLPSSITHLEILSEGVIVARGGESGQVILLIPKLENNKEITWRCVGGSYDAMPSACKKT